MIADKRLIDVPAMCARKRKPAPVVQRDFRLRNEPTGNLDARAEAEVFGRYLSLSGGKTLIMVTHRISVASLASRIVVFAGGRITEDGTHAELIAANGTYARLYREQAKWYDR